MGVTSKAGLKEEAKKLGLRVSAESLDMLKEDAADHETAVALLKAAAAGTKLMKKQTILPSHVKIAILAYKACKN
jgi:hypothetical protein